MNWIINGNINTMEEAVYKSGYLGYEEENNSRAGKIVYVGPPCSISPNDKVLDVQGAFVMPGMIEAHCHIGIMEEKIGMEGDDCNEITNPVTPYLRAIDGINPMDPAFHNAIQAGITTVMVGPGSSNIVGGQFALLKTQGRDLDDMLLKAPAAMKVAFGENPKNQYGGNGSMPSTRMAVASMLREELMKAVSYREKRMEKKCEMDFRLEPWLPVLEHQIPLKIHAHRADDILTAIRIAREFCLLATLDHCTEGHLIKEQILKSGFPAICGPHLANRNKIEICNADFKTPGELNEAGVLVALTTDHPVSMIQYLPLCAAYAVKKGMQMDEALKAITINAARICGAGERIGSLKKGKDADIVILSGSPLEVMSKVIYTIINGRIVYSADADN